MVMLKWFLFIRLFFDFTIGNASIQFYFSDVDRANHIYYSDRISIWEPQPPTRDYFILGQYVNLEYERPGFDVQLIVGRSDDDSLTYPLSFYGKLKIRGDLFVWTMRCPPGYVSLGAIATANDEKPNWKKYKCVKREATLKAELGQSIHIPDSTNSLCLIKSPRGHWKNIFFVTEYVRDNGTKTTAYTLKNDPFNNVISRGDSGLDKPQLEEAGKGKTNEKVDSYVTLIVSAGFVLLVIIVLTTLFCIRSRQMKNRNNEYLPQSTGQSYLDSTLPSSGYVSENETSFSSGYGFGRKSRNRINSSSIPYITRPSSSKLIRPRVTERRNSECVVQENILYHSVTTTNFEENEYEIINDERS